MNRSINKLIKYTFSTPSSLLTWGETTYGWARPINDDLRVPGYVEEFTDVTKVATGPYHILFATTNNDIFSAGLGDYGRLGNNSTITKDTPEQIEQLRGLDIKQLIAGYRHSLALTSSGDLYSWGFGGNCAVIGNVLKFMNSHSPLGHGNGNNALIPERITSFSSPVVHAAAGKDFSLAVTEDNVVYGWGQGIQFLSHNPSSLPKSLSQINFFLKKNHAKVTKLKAVGNAAFFLLDNGRLYVIGENDGGVFATRENPLIITDDLHENLAKVIDSDYKNERIVDFEISANSLIFRTDEGSVFYSGMHSKFRPERFPAKVGAKSIFATYDSVGIIGQNGKVYFLNDQFIDDADVEGKYIVCDDKSLKNGVVEIGGTYKLRYALVRN